MSLYKKIKESETAIKIALKQSTKQLIAFSGGKDAIVTSHLCSRFGITDAICEVSWYFSKQLASIESIAEQLSLNVTYVNSLSFDWLKNNQHIIFSNDTKVRGWTFSQRQQATVKKFARIHGYDCQIFGRRTEENSVPKHVYRTKSGLQCHPIRNWREDDVWEYFDKYGIEVPWIYSTKFGDAEGNAPFYAFHPKQAGMTHDESWELITALDPRYHPKMFSEA